MKYYTMAEVRTHRTKEDCWIVISGNIYDITEFLQKHPGGSGMLMGVAGEEVTDYFYALHKPEILDTVGSEYMLGYLTEDAIERIERSRL